ncbi:centrosomal protein of 89 kDa [Sardina pilchardus]|uniref:centrosomal protein of 89 kDa n=1 Tax=Sardina pilchardus TaxID=27697 RepID=UPI002E0DFCB1
MSKFNFSFRRSERRAFKHIAHGLIPAATIAPRAAVPRTPPPRSPNPSPERPRSALAAAILSSSLTGRTVAIPPVRARSFSESDCSRSDHPDDFQPFATTALYTRDRWSDAPVGLRPRCPSPGRSAEDDEDEEDDEEEEDDEGLEEEELSEDGHVYQSVEHPVRSAPQDIVYAVPLKLRASQSDGDELTEDSTFDIVSPLHTEGLGSEAGEAYREALEVQRELVRALREQARGLGGEKQALREEVRGAGTPPAGEPAAHTRPGEELTTDHSTHTDRRRCEEQGHLLQESQQRILALERELTTDHSTHTGESVELQSLRQQAQELVDENDALKMTLHRLNAELSLYQARYRPLTKEESARTPGLPVKGPSPPWLLDMKYLSPLLLAYEDRLVEKDTLLQSCAEEVRKLRVQTEEVVKENEKLHEQMSKTGGISHKEWKQLQEQARLVLEENQVLLEQLEVQQAKAKENQNRHHQEVAKVSKQLVLQEDELLLLQRELEDTRRELHTLQHQEATTRQQHHTDISQLTRRMEEEERRWRGELDELLGKMAALQAERQSLVREQSQHHTHTHTLEIELERSRHAHRKAQRRAEALKQQLEESMDKELTALHYLAGVVGLAEKTTHERDQLIHMASALEKDKQDVLTRTIQGTVQLAKLQEKIKVYKREAVGSVSGLGRRLVEQEEALAGQAESFLRERQHLARLLRDKQQALDGALQQKREVEFELEAVWESVSRESQRIRDAVLESPASGMLVALSDGLPADWSPPGGSLGGRLHSPPPLASLESAQRPLEHSPLNPLELYS